MKNPAYARAIEERARAKTLPKHGKVIVLADHPAWDAVKLWQLDPAAGNRPFVVLPRGVKPDAINWSFARHFDLACLYCEHINETDELSQIVGYLLMSPGMKLVLVSSYNQTNKPISYWPQRVST